MEGIKMKCPKCQFENSDGVNFCVECGSKLEKICPECGYSNSLSHKFCGGCGHELSLPTEALPKDLSFDEKLTKIQRYLPKGLTEKILSQKDRIEGERKQVTVMFCDMQGFTALSEKLGIEEAYSIMDQVYEILIHKVHDYEGTVNEMTGDGIMALFGAPVALEDAPQRAIRSAYAIHREMTKFSDKMKQEKENIPALKMRIGIHTGPVVVGTLGNDLRVEFKAVGDTVNLASRMEGLAEPGSTYVTENTFRLTEGLFRFEDLGEYSVKGRADTVKAYRVIAPSTRRTRFDVSAERGLTPFVGRERELELLLDGFERSKTGRGQAFSIMSEAGIGKSRLLYEFRKAVANEDVTFMEGKCLSYSRGVAYHPVIDIVKSNFDIAEGDGDLEIREKLKRGLKVLDTDESSTLPYLLELLSVKDSGVDPISMSPEARKDRIIGALNRITIKASQIRPVVMAIEDLHWIDKSSEDSLKALLENISGEKVFLIFTYRPEYVHTWGAKSYHSQVNLNRLSNRESLAMVTHLLGIEEIDRQLETLILEKTEGVPFFIEEFIKSLKDLKIIERKKTAYHLAKDLQEVTIPSTIQDVIMARVDTLPEGAKEVLQIGSVIEREFSYELVKQVSKLLEKELLSRLSVLKDAEVIFERGIYPDNAYIFKHALIQEVVYELMLTRRKKELHNRIGQAIEQVYKDNLHDYYGVLAEHFIKAENYKKGAEYSIFAAKKAEKTASFFDAISYANKGITSLERLPQTDNVEKRIIDTRTILGLYYLQVNYFVEAKEIVEPIVGKSFRRDYKRRLSQIYTILGAHSYLVEENFAVAFDYLDDALTLSEELNDILSLVMATYWSGIALAIVNCEFEKALHRLQKVLRINVEANTVWGISLMKSNISIMVNNYQGKVDLSYQNSMEAIQIAEESGDVLSKSAAYTSYGASCYHKGFLQEAEENLVKGAQFSERLNLFVWGAFAYAYLGDTYYDIGEYQKSQDYFEKSNSFLTKGNLMPCWIRMNEMCIERAKAMSKEKDIDLESLYSHINENKFGIYDGQMPRNIGEVLLNLDRQHTSRAENWIKKAIEGDKNNGMMWNLARDYALYAELFKRKGDLPKAKENLSKAIEIFKECGADGWVEKYEKELATL
jgi:class 3 adenylate cyclase/tetratricopeptide (TPR) repeat protein